jgi:hypothetical protein
MSQNPNSGNGNAAQGSQGQQSHQGSGQGQGQQPRNTQQGGGTQQAAGAQQGGGQGAPAQSQPNGHDTAEEVGSWFTETIVRAGVLVVGVAVMIFAIGQAVGEPLLRPLVGFFTSGTGVWLIVAFLALLVMVAATKSWRTVN